MYKIFKVLEGSEIIYVGYTRSSCDILKENVEKYRGYTTQCDYQTYMLEKGVDNFEYIIMEIVEEQKEANKVKKKYIEEYKPRFNKEPCRVPRKRKENVEGGEKRPKYTYFYRGGCLFAVPIVYPDVQTVP